MELMVDIDLTPLRQMYYRIDPLLPLEKAVIVNFRIKQTLEENTFNRVMQIFLNREYEPNGRGGLFTVNNSPADMRTVEIWYQFMWYLNEFLEE